MIIIIVKGNPFYCIIAAALRFQAFFQGSAASKSQCSGGGLNFNPTT
jgi:hypothetical protein